jgi:hypothetical protein
MELAARRRFAEARCLMQSEPLGAIYLLGYTVEMRLKAAYYRTAGLVPSSPLDPPRRIAESQIRQLLGAQGPVGHHLLGWARLLEHTRATTHGATPLAPAIASAMYQHVGDVANCWTEVLRYRANVPYNREVNAVWIAANWCKTNSRRLWS